MDLLRGERGPFSEIYLASSEDACEGISIKTEEDIDVK